jgi:hypothetical protein
MLILSHFSLDLGLYRTRTHPASLRFGGKNIPHWAHQTLAPTKSTERGSKIEQFSL